MKTAFYILVIGAIAASIIMLGKGGGTEADTPSLNNVSIVDGVQIIDIRARGGYQPRDSIAQAGMPTILRFNTGGSFDCSAAVRIPSKNISTYLSRTEPTDIDIGTPEIGKMDGMCAMGMYRFAVEFK